MGLPDSTCMQARMQPWNFSTNPLANGHGPLTVKASLTWCIDSSRIYVDG
jgi:hypothetical protein